MYGSGTSEYAAAGQEEDEMSSTERELAEDAQWKRIQQNTFTRWANEHLKASQKNIGNLETDLSDGLRLITLIEVLSGKRLPKHNKRPNFRSQKLENVSVALQFLERDENIRIVNIDSSDIVDCKLKLILGLIWTLILHYSISMPMWEGEDDQNNDKQKQTPKQRLLHWIQAKVPDLPITNFTSDWNDGRAVGAMVDSVAPGLCPDWPDWVPKDALKNATEAMSLADDFLGVPQLITPDELVNPNCDELSMMTYLSQVPNAKLKPGAPLRPRTNAGRVRCYGPGVEPSGPVVGAPTNFTIETFSAGKGKVEAFLQRPDGSQEILECKFNNDRNMTFTCTYTPSGEGEHVVTVKFSGREIPKSPFHVSVIGFAGDPTKVTASGPGLLPEGVTISRPTYFDIFTKDAGRGTPEVIILDPEGHKNTVPVKVRQVNEETWRCEYVASAIGLHSINIFFAGQAIPNSPFGVKVSPVCDSRKVRASGRGLQPLGVRVKDSADFKVYTEGAGEGSVEVKVIGPGGSNEVVTVKQIDEWIFEYVYLPKKEGRYIVMVSYGGQEIPKSPFEVNVGPYKETRIRAYGPGLKGGVVDYPALFTVETNGETGALGFSIEGPSQARIECNDNGDGSADVRYYPTVLGEYALHILCNNEDIPGSPYIAQILPNTDYYPDKVKCSGPGLEKNGVTTGKAAPFKVDTRSAGDAPLDVTVMDTNYQPVKLDAKDNKDGTFDFSYRPQKGNKHTVQVAYGGVASNDSPYRVFVSEPTNPGAVKVFGPGVEKGVKSNTPTHFNIDCREAGPGDVQIALTNAQGQDIPIDIQDNGDGTFTVEYLTPTPGDHRVTVLYAGVAIPQSPIEMIVILGVNTGVTQIKRNRLEASQVVSQGPVTVDVEVDDENSKIKSVTYNTGISHFVDDATKTGLQDSKSKKAKTQGVNFSINVIGSKEVHHSPYDVPVTLDGIVDDDSQMVSQSSMGVNFQTNDNNKDKSATYDAAKEIVDDVTKTAIQKLNSEKVKGKEVHNSPYDVPVTLDGIVDDDSHMVSQRPKGVNFKTDDDNKTKSATYDAAKGSKGVNFKTDDNNKDKSANYEAAIGNKGVNYKTDDNNKNKSAKYDAAIGNKGVNFKTDDNNKDKIGNYEEAICFKTDDNNKNKSANYDAAIGNKGVNFKTDDNNKDKSANYEAAKGNKGVNFKTDDDNKNKSANYDAAKGNKGVNFKADDNNKDKSANYDAAIGNKGVNFKTDDNNKDKSANYEAARGNKGVNFKTDDDNKDKSATYDAAKGNKGVNFKTDDNDKDKSATYGATKGNKGVNDDNKDKNATYDAAKGSKGVNFKMDDDKKDKSANYNAGKGNKGVNFKTDDDKKEKSAPYDTAKGIVDDVTKAAIQNLNSEKVKDKDNASNVGKKSIPSKNMYQSPYDAPVTLDGILDDDSSEIPQSPIEVAVTSHVDVTKVKVDGLEPSVFVDSPTDFVVDTRALAGLKGKDGKVMCVITNPSGSKTDSFVQPLPDGAYKISYTPFEEGRHTIDIQYDGIPVAGSPFTVTVRRGCDPNKCKAFGPGLDQGYVNQTNTFTVETKGAGTGGLGLAIEGPSESKMTCRDNRDGSCTVEYVPTEQGEYDVAIKFADQNIPGSPFRVNVDHSVDASLVKVTGPGLEAGKIRTGVPLNFRVDGSKSGKAPLGVDIRTDKGPLPKAPEIKDNGDGTYDVTYTPHLEGTMQTTNVTWGGKPVGGSPYRSRVKPSVEPAKVKINGLGVSSKGIPASLPTELAIDTSDAGVGDLAVTVTGPDGHPRKVKVADNGNGQFVATYVPDDCGKYKVSVKYADEEVGHSPFPVQAYATGKADKTKITEGINHSISIGEEYCITVNAKQAGNGAVTCRIRSTSGSDLDVDIEDNGDGTFSLYYTVSEPGEYTLSVKFGGQPVPDGFYSFTAAQSGDPEYPHTQSKVNGLQRTPSNKDYRAVTLNNIPLPTTGGHVTAEVKMPSGATGKPVIEDNRDGTVSIKYSPAEEGLHELFVKYNGEHVQGSPFKFHVDSISSGYVTAYGPGIVHGITGEPCNFTISTKDAGAGGLSLAVEGPSKAEISCHDNKDGTVSVSYLPTAPGEYKVAVKFAEKHIKGSPYTVKITGEGRKRNQISVGSQSEVSLPGKVTESDIKSLNASIQAPSGFEEPCFLKKLPNGHLGISFTPREIGEHLVSVKRMGTHISNSPFKITVGEKEVGDATKVKITGDALTEGKTHQENQFTIDTRDAGYGGLSLSIEGPSKADIQCKDNEDGTLTIGYKPTEPGYYIVNLKFADNHVPGSPFTAKVTGEGSNRQTERIKRQREAVPLTEVGSQCRLTFKLPGISAFDLGATVTSPGGITEAACVGEVEDGLYGVNFVPKELGVHTVSVKYQDMHIPGSPFQFTVGPLKDGGAHRVHAGGPGLERGEQNHPAEFNVWTREAGAGSLAISVEGPSKAEIDFKDRKDGSCYVSYVVTEPGEYRVGIKFNDKHIPDSPFKVYITPAMGEARKVEVGQFPEQGGLPEKAKSLIVLKNGAKGELDCKVVAPSGLEDDCFIDPMDSDTYSVRFVPKENGIHYIHVKFNGIHIPGSPFRLRIGADEGDPAAVSAAGKGLESCISGQKTDFIVDTCSAGAGTLAVTIDGPSKVSMDCTEVDEGYKVRYTPLSPGDYYSAIKYNGYHIVGSPFKVKCEGEAVADKAGTVQESASVVVETVEKHKIGKEGVQRGPVIPRFISDATKVSSKGLGLKKAHVNRQNNFTVNASDAGNNILYVGVYGPKTPCEEVYIKHTGHNNYTIGYVIRDKGDYLLIVKWGDDHIPGSPFHVVV